MLGGYSLPLAGTIVLTALTVQAAPAFKASQFASFSGWDSQSGAYKVISGTTVDVCQRTCNAESRCVGYTFVGFDSGAATRKRASDDGACYLKEALDQNQWHPTSSSIESGVKGGCEYAKATSVPNSVTTPCRTAVVCPANSHQTGSSCSCDTGFYSGGTNGDGSLKRCYQVCQPNYYPQLTSNGDPTGNCVKCPQYSYSSGSTYSCTCDATIAPRASTNGPGQTSACKCPANSNLVGGTCQCKAGWRSGGTTADGLLKFCVPVCEPGQYPDIVSSPFSVPGTCSQCPTYASSTGSQSTCACWPDHPTLTTTPAGQANLCSCPANASRSSPTSACSCNSGFYPSGTYADGSLRTCIPQCPVNQYPVLTGDGKPAGGCTPCPERSSSNGNAYQCTCDPHTQLLTTTPAGQTASCSECESPYVTSEDGTTCVLPPSPATRQRKLKRQQQKHIGLCPSGLEACAIGSSIEKSGYECVDLNDELEHCGECLVSCLNIVGAKDVACIAGHCTVASCRDGFEFLSLFNGTCRPSVPRQARKASRKSRK